jgi:hypothetical protein
MKVGAAAAVPTSGSVYSPLLKIKDQGGTSSCEGQSISNALRAAYLALGMDCPDLSASFIYYGSILKSGGPVIDDGATFRDGIKALVDIGECDEASWPFLEKKVIAPPGWKAYQNAVRRRGIRGYYSIPAGDVDRVKRTLAAKIPVVGGWELDDAFMNENFTGIQGPCKGKIIGMHAMMIESFTGNIFTDLNSWGTGYREKGRYRSNADFVAAAVNLWAMDVRP